MRTKVIIAVVLLSILSISCKNEKSVDQLPVVEEKVAESKVNVTVDMVVPVDDSFQLFYTEDNTLNFSEENLRKLEAQLNFSEEHLKKLEFDHKNYKNNRLKFYIDPFVIKNVNKMNDDGKNPLAYCMQKIWHSFNS